ncbi:MAG: nuclear transport factor 2 family protein [Candidatus Dormibacteraeota bacterium]|uniref:Nuclear transport factor 2 family protein n=1 Tax=Candidatus Aeolococcus gillhamiae TaxID=3127015 RepID=A0A934JYF7_9BACT|nr:nuclear transport factor 2 family protein [Candidatus Dormibacteraeota bacterium]
MGDSAAVADWVRCYIDVWRSGDHLRVSELFTDDAVYYTDAFRPPRRGLAEIEEYWRIAGDPPDAFEAHYDPLIVSGDHAVVTGFSRYFDDSRSRVDKEYANLFVLTFAADGRCTEYREWYMLRGEDGPAALAAAGAHT